jgi:predicted hydrocarbon binding protein
MMSEKELFIANAIMRQALMAIEEVMGAPGLKAVLRASDLEKYIENPPPDNLEAAISFEDYAKLNQAIEDFYGRGGRGMLKRIGRASFQYGIREQPALMGIAGVALKLMPKRQRIKFVLNSLGNALKKASPDTEFWVDDRDEMAYCIRDCSMCEGRQADHPAGHLLVGSITEAVLWATGEEMKVRETLCKCKGDAYGRFEIEIPGK